MNGYYRCDGEKIALRARMSRLMSVFRLMSAVLNDKGCSFR